MNNPIFSVLMPGRWNTDAGRGSKFRAPQADGFHGPRAYNAERYVGEAVESVLAQTLPDWEFLVVCNSSRYA